MKLFTEPTEDFVRSRVRFWQEGGPLWRSFSSGAPSEHPPSHRCERPVLLLYGFLATPRIMNLLARRLTRRGYCAFWVDLGGLFGGFNAGRIDVLARMVSDQVETLSRRHGIRSLDVVGHSEGGLIGRYYVQKLHGAERVRRLVTLATPHRGTPWAYPGYLLRGIVPSLAQMAPGSRLLRELDDESFPARTRLSSVYSAADALCPPSACRLETRFGAHLRNIEVSSAGHLDFLFRKRLFEILHHELRADSPPEVRPSEPATRVGALACAYCGSLVARAEMREHTRRHGEDVRQYTLSLIRQSRPEWVMKDGSCPKCAEYYDWL